MFRDKDDTRAQQGRLQLELGPLSDHSAATAAQRDVKPRGELEFAVSVRAPPRTLLFTRAATAVESQRPH